MFEIIYMNGYGGYVWSSFVFTIFCFITLYKITNNQLVKEQKKFLSKISTLDIERATNAKQQGTNKEILAYSNIYKI